MCSPVWRLKAHAGAPGKMSHYCSSVSSEQQAPVRSLTDGSHGGLILTRCHLHTVIILFDGPKVRALTMTSLRCRIFLIFARRRKVLRLPLAAIFNAVAGTLLDQDERGPSATPRSESRSR
ncbi:hypothetical protein Franean1_3985 [Parafrankia sp. EAN1pec]|nr:hypothetical protein Franean1_3985 [Frankia sp. EAN1pec]